MSFTLTVGTTTKTLHAWGVTLDFGDDEGNKQRRTVSLRTVERFDSASQWTYLQPVIIKNGAAIWFQGFFDSPVHAANGGKENLIYRAHNVWWLLEQHKYMQRRNDFWSWTTPGDPRTDPVFRTVLLPEIFLGQKADGTAQTNGDGIREVLDWFNECFNPTKRNATVGRDNAQDLLQAGTIDVAANSAVNRANNLSCADAILQLLRLSPDAVTRIDDSTTPPTLHILSEANQPLVDVDLTEEQAREISAQRQDVLELAGVIIYYRRLNTFNGVAYPETIVDVADANGTAMFYGSMDLTQGGTLISNTGMPTITEYSPFVDKSFFELGGNNVTRLEVPVTVASAADCQSASAAERVRFWKGDTAAGIKAHDTTLADPRIDPATIAIESATITDKDGNTITLAGYPNELLEGTLASWMGVNYIEANVKAKIAFHRYDDEAHTRLNLKVQQKEIHCSIKLTNAVTKNYVNLGTAAVAEDVPTGLAKKLFDSMKTPRHAGKLSLVNSQVRGDIYVGCRLRLNAPNNVFSGCVVQSVARQPLMGRLNVSYGPIARTDAPALVELARASRRRTLYNIPCDRTGGTGSAQSTMTLGAGQPKENTTKGEGNVTLFAVSDADVIAPTNTNVVRVEGASSAHGNQAVIHMQQLDADGQGVDTVGNLLIKMSDLMGEKLKIREAIVCVDGEPAGFVLTICSEVYTERKYADPAIGEA